MPRPVMSTTRSAPSIFPRCARLIQIWWSLAMGLVSGSWLVVELIPRTANHQPPNHEPGTPFEYLDAGHGGTDDLTENTSPHRGNRRPARLEDVTGNPSAAVRPDQHRRGCP